MTRLRQFWAEKNWCFFYWREGLRVCDNTTKSRRDCSGCNSISNSPALSLPSELTYGLSLLFTPAEEKCLIHSETIQLWEKLVNYISVISINTAWKLKSLPQAYLRHLCLPLQQPGVFMILKGSWLLLDHWCSCPTVKRLWVSKMRSDDAILDLTGCTTFQKREEV